MIAEYLNTLYIMKDGARVRLDHDTVRVECDGEKALQVPILHLCGLVVFGSIPVSPRVISRFCEDGRAIVFLTRGGRFIGRVAGPISGNVLLRRAQYAAIDDSEKKVELARAFVAGKLQNSRSMLQRSARDAGDPASRTALTAAAKRIAKQITSLPDAETVDQVRGIEGEAAAAVFGVFTHMVTSDRDAFALASRTRRPPLDRSNCLLSFLYALLASDCTGALESVGLDPQAGYLHALRPGKPALTLDLMEEFRPVLADRLTLTLINRKQVTIDHFVTREGGAVSLTDDGRKLVVGAYQSRKADEVPHPLLKRSIPLGIVPHVQARLLARHLRGDTAVYVPYRAR